MMSMASQLLQTIAFAYDHDRERNQDVWRNEVSAPE